MRNRCSYNADDVHIFASVPLSAAAPGPGPAGPSGAPEKLAKPTAKPTAKNDHTYAAVTRPAFHAHDTPARTIHPVKIAVSDGSAVTGRQYTVIRAYAASARSLGRWGVEQAATKNKHLGVPGRPSGWTSGRVGKCRLSSVECMVECVDCSGPA